MVGAHRGAHPGESGVGREVFARALHASGPRRAGPFVAINCAAIPEHLIESELFGHVASRCLHRCPQGRAAWAACARPTAAPLFLDEIGDMPLPLQTRLLRVLQDRSVTPVGAGHAVPVDFASSAPRIASCCRRPSRGRFRHDLYYRLNGLTVQLPALRERTDFAALTEQLLADLATEQDLPHPVQVAPDLLQRLAAHPGPATCANTPACCAPPAPCWLRTKRPLGWEHLGDDIVQALQTAAPPLSERLPGADQRAVACGSGAQPANSPAPPSTRRCKARGNVSQAAASWASAARRCTASWLRGCIDLLLNT